MKENCLSDTTTEHSLQDAKNPDWSSSFEAIGKHTFKKKGNYVDCVELVHLFSFPKSA